MYLLDVWHRRINKFKDKHALSSLVFNNRTRKEEELASSYIETLAFSWDIMNKKNQIYFL